MPGNHGKKSGIALSVKHKHIVKKYLKYIDFNKKMTLNEKENIVNNINYIFDTNKLQKIYSIKKFNDWQSNKKYRYNFNLKKNNKLSFNYEGILTNNYLFKNFIYTISKNDSLPTL